MAQNDPMKFVLLVKISCGMRGKHFTDFSGTPAALRMGVVCCFKVSVTTYQTTRYNKPEDHEENEISPL